jgi:SAM-dependent methyltransferase
MTWDGNEYQQRFDRLAEAGQDVHGEAGFVMRLRPRTVLDAGCGTGRVAIELGRRGVDVVGVDADASMLDVARQRAPQLEWIAADLTTLALGRTFDLVVMAGNVPLFTPPGTQAALVTGCARHVASGGALVAGFQLDRDYSLAEYDDACRAAGLELEARYSTWDGDAFADGATYAVSVHRRPTVAGSDDPTGG